MLPSPSSVQVAAFMTRSPATQLCASGSMGITVLGSIAPQLVQEREPAPVATQVAGLVMSQAPHVWLVHDGLVGLAGSPEDLSPQAAKTSIAARAMIKNPNTFFIFPPEPLAV